MEFQRRSILETLASHPDYYVVDDKKNKKKTRTKGSGNNVHTKDDSTAYKDATDNDDNHDGGRYLL
jgi:hypothetical protein